MRERAESVDSFPATYPGPTKRAVTGMEFGSVTLKINNQHTPHGVEADSFNNVVGIVYEKKVDLKNALVQHQKALEIQTRVFGRSKHKCSDQSTRS